jgi:hypothetical protein
VTPALLGTRLAGSLAFDARRGRVVLFGGIVSLQAGGDPVAETWEYDGGNWSRAAPPVAPPGLAGAPMVFDAARGQTVLYDTARGATWEYNGATWRRSPAIPPSIGPRYSMAYDARRHYTVVFDGSTWEFDGSQWISVGPPHLPPAPSSPTAMAFDDTRGRIELLDNAELWEFDGIDWQPRATANLPAIGSHFALVFDPARDRLVLIVFTGTVGQSAATVYELIGTSWTLHPTSQDPGGRDSPGVVYDARRRVIVVFGGAALVGAQPLLDTWEFDGTDWNPRPRAQDRAPQVDGLLAFDPDRGTAVQVDAGDTWELEAASWHLRPGAGAPDTSCAGDLMAFDARRHRVVTFGGCAGGAGSAGQTWAFDGTAWTRLSTAHAPAPSSGLAMTYDPIRDRIVLFDGVLVQTWLFDGTDWAPSPAVGPTVRFGQVMEFDAARSVTVLFGGSHDVEDGRFSVSDTWEFDGAAWTPRATAHAPPPRFAPGMTYDPRRRCMVLFGGGPRNPGDERGGIADTWEYDGTDWTLRPTVTMPPAVLGPRPMTYDSLRGRLVLAGSDTWTLSFVSEVPPELCIDGVDGDGDGLAGCADPDCAAVCAHCGDHVCNELVERAVCPLDCP